MFPIISNTTLGLRSVDPGLANYFRMNRAGRFKTSRCKLRIPGALPYFFGGLRISSGLALIGAVVAEFVAGTGGRSSGLAYEILDAGFTLDIPRMFAALFLDHPDRSSACSAAMVDPYQTGALSNWHESEMGSRNDDRSILIENAAGIFSGRFAGAGMRTSQVRSAYATA